MICFGLYMGCSPPVGDHKSPQPQDELPGIGLSRAGLGAQAAVKAAPEFVRFLEDSIPGAQLGVPDHPPREMLVDERTDGGAGPAVEAFQGRIHAKALQFLGKLGI
jgi:hypothetical protein